MIQRYFNVLVKHKLKKSDLDELIRLLIIDENYEYAGLIKEMIEIKHYDNNSAYDITKSLDYRKDMISSLDEMISTISFIPEEEYEENIEIISEVSKELKDLYSSLNEMITNREKKIKIVYPDFKTKKYISMFKVIADKYLADLLTSMINNK